MADVDKCQTEQSAEQCSMENIRRLILLLEEYGEDVSDLKADFLALYGEPVESNTTK